LRVRIAADATVEAPEVERVCRLGWLSGEWVTVDKCKRAITAAEETKLDAV
jgi:hypothetical protein